jgi:hypothetical protein
MRSRRTEFSVHSSPRLCGAVALVALAATSCSGGSGSSTTYSGLGPGFVLAPSPATLVSTCGTICNHVLTQCGAPASIYGQCLAACQDLSLVQAGCLSPFASYLTCLSGATSIQCEAGGEYLLVSPPSCEAERQAVSACRGGPPVAACAELPPGNTSCPAGTPSAGALFCIGQPTGCDPASVGAFGIGPYCCQGQAIR